MNKLFLFLTLLFSVSCSSVEFSSRSVQKFHISVNPGNETYYTKTITKDFYFWGLAPEQDIVFIEDVFENAGIFNPSYVSIEQAHTTKDIFFMLATLGLYCPSTYKITLLSNGNLK